MKEQQRQLGDRQWPPKGTDPETKTRSGHPHKDREVGNIPSPETGLCHNEHGADDIVKRERFKSWKDSPGCSVRTDHGRDGKEQERDHSESCCSLPGEKRWAIGPGVNSGNGEKQLYFRYPGEDMIL